MPRWTLRGCAAAVTLSGALFSVPAAAQTEPGRFTFDPSASEVYWRVYKAGALARLGHNHVVSVPEPRGVVELARDIADSRFEMQIPVRELVVDDAELRARHGEDFASEPSAEDVAGTRRNMLAENLLDAERHDRMTVVGTSLSGIGNEQTIDLAIELLGRAVNVTVPIDLQIEGDELTASGEFRLTHEQLGLQPFSVMMGALQVGSEIDFTFEIRAVRAEH